MGLLLILIAFFASLEQGGPAETVRAAITATILFYEGDKGTIVYRHRGRAVVAFADGSCRLVTPEAAKGLIWKPKRF